MRNPLSAAGIVLFVVMGCGPQEPAIAPLPAPAPADESVGAMPSPAAEAPKAPAASPELTPEQATKFYQDCWAAFNVKEFAKLSACYADTATSEHVDSGAPPLVGKTIVENGVKHFATAFPDGTAEAQLTLVNGNNVVAVWLVKGNHKGPLMSPTGDLPATNKKMGLLMAHSAELKAGKVVREQQFSDSRTLLGQLGLVPGPVRKVMDQGFSEKPVVIATNSEAEKANTETLKKYYEAFNKHDGAAIDALLADDFVFSDQTLPADLVGKKEAQRGYKEVFKGMSDVRAESKNAWPAGDYVVSFTSFSGTNDGPIPSRKLWTKTGKSVSLSGLEIVKIQGGKVKNHWSFAEGMKMASQLGMLPPAKDKAASDKNAKSSAARSGATPAAAGKTDAAKPGQAGGTAAAKPESTKGAAAGGKADATKAAPAMAPKAGESPKAASPAKPSEPAKPTQGSASPAPKAAAPAAPAAPAKPTPTPPAK